MMSQKGLQDLHGQKIGEDRLHLETQPKRRVGHFDVSLFIRAQGRGVGQLPVITGLFSRGNSRQKVFPWMDIHYLNNIGFAQGKPMRPSQKKGLTESLFRMIGEIIPPGGMIFLSYLTDSIWGFQSPLHEVTRRAVGIHSLQIPAAALPLGRLLFLSGCRNIKSDVYDVQGSGRLAGEKAPTPQYEEIFLKRLIIQLEEYLSRTPSELYRDIEMVCRRDAADVLERTRHVL